ncbi:MAG: MoaD/ThiS family protein [Desulfobacterales bacterium]
MPVTIYIPGSLSDWLGGKDEAVCSGGTIKECLAHVDKVHAGFLNRISDGSGNPAGVIVFLNGENINNLLGFETPVKNGDQIGIIPLAAGG